MSRKNYSKGANRSQWCRNPDKISLISIGWDLFKAKKYAQTPEGLLRQNLRRATTRSKKIVPLPVPATEREDEK